jgi:hypothetical protein
MFEAWKIGVRVSVLDYASIGLRAISGAFMRTEAEAAKLEGRIKSIHGQLLKGGLMVGAGVGILAAFRGPLDEAKKFQTETARFASLGFGTQVNNQAIQYAKGMQTIGTSTTENMALVSDAMAVFKNLDHAKFAAPIMAKMKFGNEALFGKEQGGANERKFMDMLKVIEFRGGLSSEAEFDTQANFVQKVIAGSRNRVDATALLQALKTGGVALSRRHNDAFYLGSEPLIQEFGGARYGTAAMSIYQNLVQARGTITAQQELYRLGLLDKSKVQFNNLGMLKKAMPGAFVGSDILENEGELALLQKVLLPAFKAKGITSDEAIIREFGMILGNRTGSGLMARIYQQRDQIAIQTAANAHAQDIDQTVNSANKTLGGKEIDFHAKFNNLLLQTGNVVLPMAVRALEILNPLLQSMANWMKEHPTMFGMVIKGLIGLSGALISLGTLNIIVGSFRGLALALRIAPIAWAAAKGVGVFAQAMMFSTVGGPGGIAGIGKSLTSVAGALGLVLQAASLLMAAYAGWKAGGYLNGLIDQKITKSTGGKESSLGGAIFDLWNPYNSATGKREFKPWSSVGRLFSDDPLGLKAEMAGKSGSSPYIATPSQQMVQVNSTIQLDGKAIAKSTTMHQAKAASAPQTGMSGLDSSQGPLPIGATGSW